VGRFEEELKLGGHRGVRGKEMEVKWMFSEGGGTLMGVDIFPSLRREVSTSRRGS